MINFDQLPLRDRNHEIEGKAIAAFQKRLTESGVFLLQMHDIKDYGTDCQIEVVTDGFATNTRLHVQLKGTETKLNADGSLSIQVRRSNLNYLLMQPYSIYVAYHIPSSSLRLRVAESIVRQYEHDKENWTEQESITVSFVDELTVESLERLGRLACAEAKSSRNRRIDQISVITKKMSGQIIGAMPDLHVPDDPILAHGLLMQLYEKNADAVISISFDKFAAVLGRDSDEMCSCYMAEINLGINRCSRYPERIQEAIGYFQSRLGQKRYLKGSTYYTIGNAFHALGNEQEAKRAFEAALTDPALVGMDDLAAQVHMNLGSSYAQLGSNERALMHYREALRLNSYLAEAHFALGIDYIRMGQFNDALRHLDQAVFPDEKRETSFNVMGWRANVLFNLGDGRAAFREISSLITRSGHVHWIWPWCSRLVASFGRVNVDNARQAIAFWDRYIKENQGDSAARWEFLMTMFYLRGQNEDLGKNYITFRDEFDRHIALVDNEDAALPWDRLGHWAQDEGDWVEAERCFRKAYEMAGGEYGYCLAIALNELNRFEESIPLLLAQAHSIQPDSLSWFHLASTYASLHRWPEAIDAYKKSLAAAPDDAVTMFELGGAYLNSGDLAMAAEIWSTAITRFPEHEFSAKVTSEFSFVFNNPSSTLSK